MSAPILIPTYQGRFGNQAMQFLFAYAVAQRFGMKFQSEEWIGEKIFALPPYERPQKKERPRWNEMELAHCSEADLWQVGGEVEFRGYAQMQTCVDFYRKRDAQAWLKLRPEIETACANAVLASYAKDARVVCHERRGDYFGYSYPVISSESYYKACERFGLVTAYPACFFCKEESPIRHEGHLPDDLSFMPDFYRMMTAPTLLRGNSSFSWLAALLGDGLVLSPIVDGLEGGKEHDCVFVAGNHPRFANFDFVTDLHVSP